MKKKVRLAIICGTSLFVCSVFFFSQKSQVRNMILDNTEALASADGYEYYCIGKGTVSCPSGHKVDYVVAIAR